MSDVGVAVVGLGVLILIVLGFWKAVELAIRIVRFILAVIRRERGFPKLQRNKSESKIKKKIEDAIKKKGQ